jgi:hypothetical protein
VVLLAGGPPEGQAGEVLGAASGAPGGLRRYRWPALGLAGVALAAVVAFPPSEAAPPPSDPAPLPIALTADPWYDLAPGGLVLNLPLRADAGRWEVRTGSAEPGVEFSSTTGSVLAPGSSGATTMRLSIDCDRALPAPRVNALTLAVAPWPAGGPTRPWRLETPWFEGYWDDALHTACGVRSAAGAVAVEGVAAAAVGRSVETTIRLRNVSDATARVFVTGSAVEGVSARAARLAEPKGVFLQPGEVVDLPVAWTPRSCPSGVSARGPVLRTEVITPTSDREVLTAFGAGFDGAWLAALAEACPT